jgi:Flp pilus assembly protein TadD
MSPLDSRTAAALVVALLLWTCGPGGENGAPAQGAPDASGRRSETSPKGALSRANGAAETVPGAPSLQTGLQLFRQGDLKGAEPHLVGALKIAPRDRLILEALGSIYGRTDRWKQAEESFRAALTVEPASIGARLGLATVFIDTGRYDEARSLLLDVRQRDPGNAVARLKGALLDVRLGRGADAEAGAREAIARRPSDGEAHYVLGLALEQEGELEKAAEAMRRVHDLAPSHVGALSHLVTIETRLGRKDEVALWRKAQQEALFRVHVEERVRDHRIKGVAAFNREDYKAALQEFRAIETEDPGDPQVHLHLGSTYIALGNLEEAKRELDRCLSLDPRNDRALAEMGRMHALAGRLDAAIEALEKAVAVNPQFAEPHYYLAGIYMERGEPERYQEEMKIFRDLSSLSQGSALEVKPSEGP